MQTLHKTNRANNERLGTGMQDLALDLEAVSAVTQGFPTRKQLLARLKLCRYSSKFLIKREEEHNRVIC